MDVVEMIRKKPVAQETCHRAQPSDQEWPPVDLSRVHEEYICPSCQRLLTDVHQTYDCGCRFCLRCLTALLDSGADSCPTCQAALTSQEKVEDKFFQKKLNRLVVKCLFDGGAACQWTGMLTDYRGHYAKHMADAAKARECQLCGLGFKAKHELIEHLDEVTGSCPEQTVSCPFSGCHLSDQGGSRNLVVDEESQRLDTTATMADEAKTLRRGELDRHLDESTAYHLEVVYEELTKRLERLEQSAERDRESQQSRMSPSSESLSSATGHGGRPRLSRLESQVSCSRSIDDCGYSTASGSGSGSAASEYDSAVAVAALLEPRLAEERARADLLEAGQAQLVEDLTRLARANELLKEEGARASEAVAEYKTVCADLQRALAMTQVSLLAAEEKLAQLQAASYDGSLLWKVSNVRERLEDARCGRQASLCSPPFYTHRHGYKLLVRLFLNGEGQGKASHLSAFLVVARGDFDALLPWPFRHKCTFALLDQSAARDNISDSFRPEATADASSSFKRPTSEMNVAAGLPLFCPLGLLLASDRYLRDNVLFLKVTVDTA